MVSLPTVKVPGVIKSLGGVTVGVLGLDVGTALPLLLLLPQAASNKECSYTKYVLYISSVTSVPDCAQESIKLQTQTTVVNSSKNYRPFGLGDFPLLVIWPCLPLGKYARLSPVWWMFIYMIRHR